MRMRLLLYILIVLNSNLVIAKEIVVCKSCDVKDLSAAVNMAQNGDVITLKEGDYQTVNVVVDKSIQIRGEGSACLLSANGGEIITISAPGVVVKGLCFEGVSANYLKENAAIRVKRTKEFLIEDNAFTDCFYSVYLEKAKHGKIVNNVMRGNSRTEAASGDGIHAWYCDSLLIQGNDIQGHRDGIYLEFVNKSLIVKNYSCRNLRYGLHFMFSNDDVYIQNIFEKNGVGVAVMFSRRIEMEGNSFMSNWGNASYGLLLKEIYDGIIVNNQFTQNTVGIFVEGSNRIEYSRNTFKKNGWAIKFSGGCESNMITNNNFILNSQDMLVSSGMMNSEIIENYWSAYKGYDLDKDGYGDIPYYPVKLYTYMLSEVPESVVLMRSLFVDLVNFAENVSPVFTPKEVYDSKPLMDLLQ